MNTTPADAASPRLPDLTDDRVDVMEEAIFAGIAEDRRVDVARRTRRGRVWIGAGAAAAVVVVAAVLAPTIARVVSPTAEQYAGSSAAVPLTGAAESGVVAPEIARDAAAAPVQGGAADAAGAAKADAAREIISSGSATLVVDDVADAARRVGAAAIEAGGYIESTSIGRSGAAAPFDGGRTVDVAPYPGPVTDGGWISIRVPSADLAPIMDDLSAIGEVTASSVSRQDVTDQAVDLRARIDAAQTSVTRLTELMAQASSTADLIAAESALAERQATLESARQQLATLEAQVDLASLSVSLEPRTVTVSADPAGFGDGLFAGWNGLVATLNGIVVALGFLLPWIVVAGIVAVIVWVIRRRVRRSRGRTVRGRGPSADGA